MNRKRSMTRSLAVVSFVLLIVATGYAHAGDCFDNDVRNAIVGGWVGAAAKGGSLIRIQGGPTDMAAGARETFMTTLTTDCTVGFCIPPHPRTGLEPVIFSWWLFAFDFDCAGAISISERSHQFYTSWNRESNSEAYEDGKDYCEDDSGESCKVLAVFRHCGAAAMDYTKDVFGIGTARTAYEAEQGALKGCRAQGGTSCRLNLSAKCNAG